jgi:hypothetical protein
MFQGPKRCPNDLEIYEHQFLEGRRLGSKGSEQAEARGPKEGGPRGQMKGSLHRKQKISYETSGRNPKNLDLLDGGSEDEMQSLTLEECSKRFVDAGVGLSIPATRLI